MSVDVDDDLPVRAGQLTCACPPVDAASAGSSVTLAIGFGVAVLAQALVLSVLPEQSRLLAPFAARVGWPFAALLVGAAMATVPAALLIDAFGRRAGFALGASLGAAGGALCAFSIARANFYGLCLGAFWLGLAQGFSLFYRHIAAQGAARNGLIVLAGGAGAALAAPLAVAATELFGGGAGATLLGAAALHVGALALSVRLPHALGADNASRSENALPSRFFIATLAGALAWLLMAAAMLHGPLTLAVCSAGPSFIGGAMAWHLFAMYGPAALAARWPGLVPPLRGAGAGLAIMVAGGVAVNAGASVAGVTAGLIAIGVGWSLVNIATLRLLHEGARPSRAALAFHDLCLLGAAAAGALAF